MLAPWLRAVLLVLLILRLGRLVGVDGFRIPPHLWS
jgi:hypothetical protein